MDPKTFSDRVEAEIVRPLLPSIVPLYLRARDHRVVRAKPCGTATLLQVGASHFLVTAAHVTSDVAPGDELVMVNAMNGSTFTVPWTNMRTPKNAALDVAVLELSEKQLHLFEKLTFFNIDKLDISQPRPDEVYAVVGYPQELAPATHERGQQHVLALSLVRFDGFFSQADMTPRIISCSTTTPRWFWMVKACHREHPTFTG